MAANLPNEKERQENISYIHREVIAPVITQSMMLEYERLNTNADIIKRRLEDLEGTLVAFLRNPECRIEDGELECVLKENTYRRPAWKEHFIEEVGKPRADEIIECTPYKTSYKPLVRVKGSI